MHSSPINAVAPIHPQLILMARRSPNPEKI
jgi:hypothetical protein